MQGGEQLRERKGLRWRRGCAQDLGRPKHRAVGALAADAGWPAGGGAPSAARRRGEPASPLLPRFPPLAGSFLCALARAPQRPPALPAAVSLAAPPRRRPSATMAHRGPPRAPTGPGPTARVPSPGTPPPPRWPRSRPLLLLLLLLAACGAAGRSPEPGRLGPRARVTRVPRSPLAGRAEPGGREDRQAHGAEPGAPGSDPGPVPGPDEDGAPASSRRRWARAAPVAGAASRAQVSLISTSFVLKGDATHNQAMVHWTGENSSVSDLRALPADLVPDTWPQGDCHSPPLPDHPRSSWRAFLATWGCASPPRRPYWPLVTGYLGERSPNM